MHKRDMKNIIPIMHDGSLSTGHANSVADMLSRLETMVLSGASLPVEVVRQQIGSAIDVMIHLSRFRDRSRRVTEITELAGFENGELRLNPLYVFAERGEDDAGRVIGELAPTGGRLLGDAKLKLAGLHT